MQDSNGSVKAFESFHNVEREKVESPSRRLEIKNEKKKSQKITRKLIKKNQQQKNNVEREKAEKVESPSRRLGIENETPRFF